MGVFLFDLEICIGALSDFINEKMTLVPVAPFGCDVILTVNDG